VKPVGDCSICTRSKVAVLVLDNCTVTGIAGSPRGPRATRGYGDKVHGLTEGMGPIIRVHRGDGFNNLRGHRGHGVSA